MTAKEQFARVLSVLPCGASEFPCKLLTAGYQLGYFKCLGIFIQNIGYMMLLAAPLSDQVNDLVKAPMIAVVGPCSLGKTATNALLMNHFSDKVFDFEQLPRIFLYCFVGIY